MRFAKYHGIGNDFLVVDLRDVDPALAAAIQEPQRVVEICDRRFGVGGDGILAITASPGADARMRVLNSDGSEAEMCGNGIRCVAKEMHDRLGFDKPELAIDTGAGRLVCTVQPDGRITVRMGAPRLTRAEIPMTGPAAERCLEQPLDVTGRPVTAVSMGNPHAITFVDVGQARAMAEQIGPKVELHPWFPQRTNAEFAHVVSRGEIDLVVWERGCGITMACGTGACATAVAGVLTGRTDNAVRVNLPGGALAIEVLPDLSNVLMTGPAQHVFDGELPIRA